MFSFIQESSAHFSDDYNSRLVFADAEIYDQSKGIRIKSSINTKTDDVVIDIIDRNHNVKRVMHVDSSANVYLFSDNTKVHFGRFSYNKNWIFKSNDELINLSLNGEYLIRCEVDLTNYLINSNVINLSNTTQEPLFN